MADEDGGEKAEMKRALEELEPLRTRISMLPPPEASPGTARVNTDVRSFLKFVDMELSAILVALRGQLTWKEQGGDRIVRNEDMEPWVMKLHWLAQIRQLNMARPIGGLLDWYERPPPCHAVLLHRAARCCCRRIAKPEYWVWVEFEYIANLLAFLAQHPLMYKRLLLVGDDGDDTASTSSRTYHHLPYWLKLLLLYMVSMFPQGYKFDKSRLIWKWASEGLIGQLDLYVPMSSGVPYFSYYNDYNASKAGEYFSELVAREVIIQAANYGHKPAAEAEDCLWQVNPDMFQFLASESADKGFVCTSGMLNSAAPGGDKDCTEILRRLSLHQPDPELPTLLETMDLSHTRSLAVSGAVDGIPLGKFIYLRVLDLEGWENLKDEDLLQISSTMFLLTYLSVSNTGVTRLPPEIKELRHLEALNVSHTQISELPPEACELERLGTLDLRSTQVRQLPELTKLWGLLVGGDGINPDETVTKIPEGIVYTGELRILATVDLSECSESFVQALGGLRDLEVLVITWSCDGRYRDVVPSPWS